jgi:hypothetical protein
MISKNRRINIVDGQRKPKYTARAFPKWELEALLVLLSGKCLTSRPAADFSANVKNDSVAVR